MRLLSLVFACGLALLSGCSSSSTPEVVNEKLTIVMNCGAYNAGASIGAVLAFSIDPVPVAPVTLPVSGGGASRTVTCPAGQRLCLVAWPDLAAAGHTWSASANVGYGPQGWSCQPDANQPLAQPAGTAVSETGQVRVSWQPVAGAVRYKATLRGLGFATGAAPQELATASTAGTELVLPFTGTTPGLAVVELEAWAMDPAAPPAGAISNTMTRRSMRALPLATGPITLKQPSDFTGNTLDLPVAAGNRLAVILLNVSWVDRVPATIQATGTGPSPAMATRLAAREPAQAGPRRGPGLVALPPSAFRSVTSRLAPVVPATAPPASRNFCVAITDAGGNYMGHVLRSAQLGKASATANFYLDDQVVAEFTTGDLDSLASRWEASQAQVVSIAGAPADRDGNGKVTILFSNAYVWSDYVNQAPGPADLSAACTSDTGYLYNGGETIFAPPFSSWLDAGGLPMPKADVLRFLDYVFPHALQHLVDIARESSWNDDAWYESWMLEGRAELMTDLVGRGLQDDLIRSAMLTTFGRDSSWGYNSDSLTSFEYFGVDYSSVHLLFRYLADRMGPAFIPALFHGEGTGMGLLEKASGLPFPLMYGLWTSSLLFSNEPSSPGSLLDYTGTPWTPLHQKFQPFQYAPLDPGAAVPLTLRSNGFDVYVTGPAGAGGGTVTVGSAAGGKPYVVAIPFTGTLPAAP
jgi:hypothetical protein